MTKTKSSSKSSSSKTEKCACGKDCKCACCERESAFPICFLACVMTAVLVALAFAISFTTVFSYDLKHKYGTRFSGQFAEDLQNAEDGKMLEISAGSVVDFYESGQTGFIYASSDQCSECASFEERLVNIASGLGTLPNVYHYNYPADNDPSEYDYYAMTITSDGETDPVLLYVRGGKIYDRLDDYYGEAGVSSFLAKYKESN